MDELSKKEIKMLKEKGYLFNSKTEERIYSNYELFLVSLKKNYLKTIRAVGTYCLDDVDFCEMDRETSEEIYDILRENHFCVDNYSIDIIEYNPLFLISSLQENYYRTIDLLLKKKHDGSFYYIPPFVEENKMLKDVLVDNEFVLTKKNIDLLKTSSIFLIASLEVDFDKTIKLLNKENIEFPFFYIEEAELVIELVFSKKGKSFESLPPVLKNVIVAYMENGAIDKRDYIFSLVDKGFVPITYVPSSALFFESRLWNLSEDENVCNYVFSNYNGSKTTDYNESKERDFINLLGPIYKDCEKLEDVLLIMHKRDLKRENMTILEMMAIQLYGVKQLYNNGLSGVVDAFAVDMDMESAGECAGENVVSLNINANCDSVMEMVCFLNHEIEHAIQLNNIKTGNIANDHDIDIYSIDEILVNILGHGNYYQDNYYTISYEFDAEFKAYIKTAKLFGVVDIIYEHENDLLIMQENADKTISFAKDVIDDEGYKQENSRNTYFSLNDLFIKEMNKLLSDDRYAEYEQYIKKYPIIEYGYGVFGGVFRQKTIEELVENFENSQTKSDKGVYYNLLNNRFRVDREDEETINQNLEVIKKLFDNGQYSDMTRKMLAFIEKKCMDCSCNKYQGYFYKIGGNKR